jgi:hypothetical protein
MVNIKIRYRIKCAEKQLILPLGKPKVFSSPLTEQWGDCRIKKFSVL